MNTEVIIPDILKLHTLYKTIRINRHFLNKVFCLFFSKFISEFVFFVFIGNGTASNDSQIKACWTTGDKVKLTAIWPWRSSWEVSPVWDIMAEELEKRVGWIQPWWHGVMVVVVVGMVL